MRISSNTIYDLGIGGIQQQTSDLIKLQQQVSTGRRILTPADDPVASARVLEVTQSSSLVKQYDVNTDSATSSLGLEESILASVGNLIMDVRTVAVNAGNPTLSNQDRAALAAELRGRYQELLGLANSADGNGQYLFSGYKGATQPFAETSPGNVTYQGDQGQRLIQISPSRQIAVSDSGSDVFERIKNGNGTFVAAAGTGNTGSGVISPGTATTAYDGNKYRISFASATTYNIEKWDSTLVPPDYAVVPGGPYTYSSGSAISVGGGQVQISGSPAAGDTFTIDPSGNQSLFTTLGDLITLLETPVSGAAGNANLTNGLNTALSNLDNALDNVLKVRASVGARMKEVDSVKSTGEDLQLQYQQTLSNLQDLDYAKAISDLTRQQVNLEAAQKSFVSIQGLSLFNYINP